jgi:hypothetical protein
LSDRSVENSFWNVVASRSCLRPNQSLHPPDAGSGKEHADKQHREESGIRPGDNNRRKLDKSRLGESELTAEAEARQKIEHGG